LRSLALVLLVLFLCPQTIILGDARGYEHGIGMRNVIGVSAPLSPIPRDLQLAPDKETTCIGLVLSPCLSQTVPPNQKLAILLKPGVEGRHAQQCLVRHLQRVASPG